MTDARASIHAMFPLDEAATAELDARLDAHRMEARTEAADWLSSYPFPSSDSDWERGRDDTVAWVVRVLRNPDPQRADAPTPAPDTLAHWLYRRFGQSAAPWEDLDLVDREYWEHEAKAVRRAVARGGFRTPDPKAGEPRG